MRRLVYERVAAILCLCFALSLLGVIWLSIEEAWNHRTERTLALAKQNKKLLEEINRYRTFYEACAPIVGEWVKVECGQMVMRCVHIERERGRMNTLEAVVVGSALEFCKPREGEKKP